MITETNSAQSTTEPYRCPACGQEPTGYAPEVLEFTTGADEWETITAAAYHLVPCGHVVTWRRGSRG